MATLGTTNFPTTLDNHATGQPVGFAAVPSLCQTALDGPISASATTVVVLSTAGFASTGYFAVGTGNGDTELIAYSGITANSFTGCIRAQQGSTARAFASGVRVAGIITPESINAALAAIVAIETVLGAGVSSAYGVMRKIAETVLAAPASTIDFTAIPAVYRNLRLVFTAANNTGTTTTLLRLSTAASFDTGNNYDNQYTASFATNVSGTEALAGSSILVGAHSAFANAFVPVIVDFVDYRGGGHKGLLWTSGQRSGTSSGNLTVFTGAAYWRNTGAIDGIRLLAGSNSFAIGSRATLYGVPS